MTPVKVLKKIVPEQIKAATQDQIPAGEAHDIANLGTPLRFITMDRAIFTGRLRVERAGTASGNGIIQKLPALWTKAITVSGQIRKDEIILQRPALCRLMLLPAPAINKTRQQAKIFEFVVR